MKYKRRDDVFTISAVLDQIIEYAYENKKLPKTIFLPPEEYIYLPYLFETKYLVFGCIELMGIPVKMYFKKQDKKFTCQ